MALVVQKYCGSALTDAPHFKQVAERIVASYNAGNDVVVVASAMAGETDRLIAQARTISATPEGRDYDLLLATGEQVTVGLLGICLTSMGYQARSYLGWQVPIITDAVPARASIKQIDPAAIKADLKQGAIVIVAGFQGIDDRGSVTTLGRGGADTSAVALAEALGAEVCELYTDVEGVFTADPAICRDARKIGRISYDEMLELAGLGEKVIQIRALEYAKKYQVDIHIRSAFSDNNGTLVTKEDAYMEGVVVSGVVYDKSEAKIAVIGVPDKPGVAARILTTLADADISVDMIVQNVSQTGLADLTFTVAKSDLQQAYGITGDIARELGAQDLIADEHISKISIVGLGMRNHAGVAARMFTALAFNNINIQMISTSEIKVAVAIDEKYTELAVRVLHDTFGLAM